MRKWIHYGHKSFDGNRFMPIRNCRNFLKPHGGLWASPVDAEFGWKAWCEREEFRECDAENSFTFTLKPEAKVLRIKHIDDLIGLPRAEDALSFRDWCLLDFEKLLELGYDAIELVLSADPRLYWRLYGWDCDSILVMNPEVIVNV